MVEHGKMKELDHHEKAQEMGKSMKKLLQLQTSEDFLKWIVDAKRSNKNDFLLCSLEFYGTLA